MPYVVLDKRGAIQSIFERPQYDSIQLDESDSRIIAFRNKDKLRLLNNAINSVCLRFRDDIVGDALDLAQTRHLASTAGSQSIRATAILNAEVSIAHAREVFREQAPKDVYAALCILQDSLNVIANTVGVAHVDVKGIS